MKKLLQYIRLFAIASVLALLIPQNARAQCTSTFIQSMDSMANTGSISNFIGSQVALFPHPNGHFFVTGLRNDSTTLSYFDASGALLWTDAFKYTSNGQQIRDMFVDQTSGDVIGIANYGQSGTAFRYNISTHSLVWAAAANSGVLNLNIHSLSATEAIITTSRNSSTHLFKISKATGAVATGTGSYSLVSEGGEFYSTLSNGVVYGACRRYYNATTDLRASLFAHDAATGAFLWQKSIISNGAVNTTRMYPIAPVKDVDSLLVLASGDLVGTNTYNTGPVEMVLCKTNDTGAVGWTKQYVPTGTGYDRPNVTAITNTANGYYLIGNFYSSSLSDFAYGFVIKTDKQGNVLWARRLGTSNRNEVNKVMERNGALFLAMSSKSFSPNNDLLLIKLDLNGNTSGSCSFVSNLTVSVTTLPNVQNALASFPNPVSHSQFIVASTPAPITVGTTTYCATCCPNIAVLTPNHSNGLYCINDTAHFTTTLNGVLNPAGGFSYQWYYKVGAGTYSLLPAANGGTMPNPNPLLSSAGTYTFRLVISSLGGNCKDTAFSTISVGQPVTTNVSQSVCDSFRFNGTLFTSSGNYTQHYSTQNGCDSAVTLVLTVSHSTSTTINATSCTHYALNGVQYNASGIYEQHYTNAAGCDSMITLNLSLSGTGSSQVCDTSVNIPTQGLWYLDHMLPAPSPMPTLFAGNPGNGNVLSPGATWIGFNVNAPASTHLYFYRDFYVCVAGTYSFNFGTASDNTLNVYLDNFLPASILFTVNAPGTASFTQLYNCSTSRYLSAGHHVLKADVYNFLLYGGFILNGRISGACIKDTACSSTGTCCSSSVLNVHSCGPYLLNGQTYLSSGIYTQTLVNAAGCDSTINLYLTILPVPVPVVSISGAVLSTTQYVSYQWYRNGIAITGAKAQSYTRTQWGSYRVEVADSNGCKGVSADTTHGGLGVSSLVMNGKPVLIVPNPAKDFIQLSSAQVLDIVIYNAMGQAVLRKAVAPGDKIAVNALATGVYLIRETRTGRSIGQFIRQ